MERWATFDCYGTLIDWEGGIRGTLERLWPGSDLDALLAHYHEAEPAVQAGSAMKYREVMALSLERVARADGLELSPLDRDALGRALPSWPAFPEVRAALEELQASGWRVGILSNTDPDLLASSLQRIGVRPDLLVTVEEAGSYKPEPGHWRAFRELSGADPARHVHVGASLFHDVAPAGKLGITVVWINRLEETSDLPRAAELRDLSPLPETLEGLVPPA